MTLFQNIAGRVAFILCACMPASTAAQHNLDMGSNGLRIYNQLGRNYPLMAKQDEGLLEVPEKWSAEQKFEFLGVLNNGSLESPPVVSAEDILMMRDPIDGALHLFRNGQRFSALPVLQPDGSLPMEFEFLEEFESDFPVEQEEDLALVVARLINATPHNAPLKLISLPDGVPERGTEAFAEYERSLHRDFRTGMWINPTLGNDFSTGGPQFPPTSGFPGGLGNDGEPIEFVWSRDFYTSPNMRLYDPGLHGTAEQDEGVLILSCSEATSRHPVLDRGVPCGLTAVVVEKENTYKKKTHCSGVVISPRHVLTAAHCLFPKTTGLWSQFTLFDPTKGVADPDKVGIVKPLARYSDTMHDVGVDARTRVDFFVKPDLALLRLHNDRRFIDARVPRIYTGDVLNRGMIAFGYGLNPDREVTGVRQIVILGQINELCRSLGAAGQSNCNEGFEFVHSNVENWRRTLAKFARLESIPTSGSQIIAVRGQSAEGALLPDTCSGDSGGPVFIQDDVAWSVAAITSRALVPTDQADKDRSKCTGYGSINVRLGAPEIKEWIRSHLEDDGCPAVSTHNTISFPKCE